MQGLSLYLKGFYKHTVPNDFFLTYFSLTKWRHPEGIGDGTAVRKYPLGFSQAVLLTVTALGLFPVPLPEKGTAAAEDKFRRESHPSTVALNVTPLIHIKMGFFGCEKKEKILHNFHLVLLQ